VIRVDWTLVGKPGYRLSLRQTLPGRYTVVDQRGRRFCPASGLETCVRFMRAFAKRYNGVELDEASISRERDAAAIASAEEQAALPLAPVIPISRGAA
jgi:hypothetical protein